ncbi:MAG: gliding motility-associated C-terminal domain-containing protein [Saprospiraceae bacterium]
MCNIPCDTATVTIEVQNLPKVPTGLVVNDPGLNGALTIKGLSGFSKAEINIFDRWGDLVFLDDDYKNTDPWQGDYRRSGRYLPGGAYYYFLKVYDGAEQIGKTITGVIHLFEK